MLAAHRAGIKRVLVPERNKADLDEVPAEVENELEFIACTKMDQVLEAALEEKLTPKPATEPPSSRRTDVGSRRRRDARASHLRCDARRVSRRVAIAVTALLVGTRTSARDAGRGAGTLHDR